MRIKAAVIAALFMDLLMVYGTFAGAVDADWVLVHSRSGVNFYYDGKSISQISPARVVLDTKTTFETDAVRQRIIIERRSRGLSVEGWKKLHHIVNRVEIDCSLKRYHFISGSHYDEGGNLLKLDTPSATRWSPIIDNSPMMFTYDAVCRAPKR